MTSWSTRGIELVRAANNGFRIFLPYSELDPRQTFSATHHMSRPLTDDELTLLFGQVTDAMVRRRLMDDPTPRTGVAEPTPAPIETMTHEGYVYRRVVGRLPQGGDYARITRLHTDQPLDHRLHHFYQIDGFEDADQTSHIRDDAGDGYWVQLDTPENRRDYADEYSHFDLWERIAEVLPADAGAPHFREYAHVDGVTYQRVTGRAPVEGDYARALESGHGFTGGHFYMVRDVDMSDNTVWARADDGGLNWIYVGPSDVSRFVRADLWERCEEDERADAPPVTPPRTAGRMIDLDDRDAEEFTPEPPKAKTTEETVLDVLDLFAQIGDEPDSRGINLVGVMEKLREKMGVPRR